MLEKFKKLKKELGGETEKPQNKILVPVGGSPKRGTGYYNLVEFTEF